LNKKRQYITDLHPNGSKEEKKKIKISVKKFSKFRHHLLTMCICSKNSEMRYNDYTSIKSLLISKTDIFVYLKLMNEFKTMKLYLLTEVEQFAFDHLKKQKLHNALLEKKKCILNYGDDNQSRHNFDKAEESEKIFFNNLKEKIKINQISEKDKKLIELMDKNIIYSLYQ
jgi:hypothetical protein